MTEQEKDRHQRRATTGLTASGAQSLRDRHLGPAERAALNDELSNEIRDQARAIRERREHALAQILAR